MSTRCEPLNPLQREGTAQRNRLLDALRPENAKIDERGLADWLLYAREYAKLVRFYNAENREDGDWSAFFIKDITTLVAIVGDEDLDALQGRFDVLKEKVLCADLNTEFPFAFGKLLGYLYEVADTLAGWERDAIPDHSFQQMLVRLRTSIIQDGYDRLFDYLKRAADLGAVPILKTGEPADLRLVELTWPLSENRTRRSYLPKGLPGSARLVDLEVDTLERLFKRFQEAITSIVHQAPVFLNETLENYPRHEPYMALFLAFLKLMEIARDFMNTLTKRHLDFYYREVLQLEPSPAEPDQVHVILELAQNFQDHQLKKDTLFDAGRIGDNDISFKADNELVVNRGRLSDDGLKTVFLEMAEGELGLDNTNDREILNIYASPIANSLDGNGIPFEQEPGIWDTLGSTDTPFGRIGFAVASPILLLKEGVRNVKLTFFFSNLADIIGALWEVCSKSGAQE